MITQTLIAPNAQPYMTFFGQSGKKYTSDASGNIAGVLPQDVESFLNSAGCTTVGTGNITLGGDLSGTPANAQVVDIGGVPVKQAITTRPAPPQIVCGVGFQHNQVTGGIGANNDLWELRKPHSIGPQDVTDIQFAYCPWYEQDNGAGEAPSPNGTTITAALEIPADTATGNPAVVQKFFFKTGTSALAVTAGAPLILTEPAQIDVPANSLIYEQTSFKMADVNLSYVNGGVPRSGDNGYYSPSANGTQIGKTGNWSTPTGGTFFQLGGAVAIIGRPVKTHVAIAHMGDSITQGDGR